jgi:hypothetical protein
MTAYRASALASRAISPPRHRTTASRAQAKPAEHAPTMEELEAMARAHDARMAELADAPPPRHVEAPTAPARSRRSDAAIRATMVAAGWPEAELDDPLALREAVDAATLEIARLQGAIDRIEAARPAPSPPKPPSDIGKYQRRH